MTTQQLIVLGLKASIIITVFGFGLRARPSDVMYIVRRPWLLGRSLLSMFVVMPVVAIALGTLFNLKHAVAIALVALALSPVPPILPRKEGKAGGHNAYAIGLLVVAGLLSIVIVPLGVYLVGRYLGQPFAMPAAAIANIVLKMIVLPIAAGMLVFAFLPRVAERIAKPAGILGISLLALGAVAVLVVALPAILELLGDGTLVAMAVFVVIGLTAGHFLAGTEEQHRTVLALSTASRHPGIALAIAKANFPDEPLVGAAILLYLLVTAVITFPYVARRKRGAAAATAAQTSAGQRPDHPQEGAVRL